MPSQASTVADFEAWMRSVGIKWNSEAITITDATASTMLCSGLALGITAARDIKDGDDLCPILPKSACICPLTCSIADILEKEELNSGLGLVIAVMHESSLGTDSKWAGYFAAMPHREYLPVFWNKEQLQALQGTEIENSASEDLANVEDDYTTHVLPLLSTYPDRFKAELCTLQHFHYAASLVASRMFGIDDVHGAGMVPLADVFNHKASVVDLAPEYAVHGADDSEESDSEEESGEEGEEEEEEEGDGGNVGEEEEHHHHHHHHHSHDHNHESTAPAAALPTVMRRHTTDNINTDDVHHHHHPAVHALHGITKANGLHLALEIAIIDGGDHLQIVAASDIPAGNEVHNTYGELGNDVLVKKYGFALRKNPFNTVQLMKDDVINACKELYTITRNDDDSSIGEEGSEPAAKKRKKGGKGDGKKSAASSAEQTFKKLLKVLEDETDLLNEEEGEEPFEVLPNGHIGPALFATLRVLCSGVENLKNAAETMDDALKVGGEEGEGENAVLDMDSIIAVQVFPVTNEEGDLLSKQEALDAAAAAEGNNITGSDSKQGSHDTDASSTASSMVTKPMCTALFTAVQSRLAKYPSSIEDTVAELKNFEKNLSLSKDKLKGNNPTTNTTTNNTGEDDVAAAAAENAIALSEGQTARRAALTLRLTEQELLKGMEMALKIKIEEKLT
jgi:SET domain-containing protein 6